MANVDRYVNETAEIKYQRSVFSGESVDKDVKYSMKHGTLKPILFMEVLPGDTFIGEVSDFTRMVTPINPFMDYIRKEIDCFFVPKRILFNKTKQFYGEAEDFGIATSINEPTTFLGLAEDKTMITETAFDSFAVSFGTLVKDMTKDFPINLLPVRAYLSIYNEYYRDQNYQSKYMWDKDESGYLSNRKIAYLGSSPVLATSDLPLVNKDKDVVTSILPWQQKGPDVNIFGDIPIMASSELHDMGNELRFNTDNESYLTGVTGLFLNSGNSGDNEVFAKSQVYAFDSDASITRSNLVARASAQVGANVASLVYSIAYQNFLSLLGRGGSRYREYIKTFFGTSVKDSTEDIPEFIGRVRIDVNVDQVLQTTGYTGTTTSELGSVGANSVTGTPSKGPVIQFSPTEPGYLIAVTYCKHKRTYSGGFEPVFLKHKLLDYYQRPFANIYDQPFIGLHISDDNTNVVNGDIHGTDLGFQEPWWDYHSSLDRCYSALNPSLGMALPTWTLAEQDISLPIINGSYLKENRNSISRVVTTPSSGFDYICDTYFKFTISRVMPVYAQPGKGIL